MIALATSRTPGPSGRTTPGPPEIPPRTPSARRRNVVQVVMGVAIAAMTFLIPAGTGNTAPADVFLAAAIFISALWFSSQRQAVRFPYAVPIGLSILAGALASTVYYSAAYVSVGGGLVTLIQDAFLLAWGITIANLSRDPALLRTITRAWVISVTCYAALMIIGVFGHIPLLSGEIARNGVRACRSC